MENEIKKSQFAGKSSRDVYGKVLVDYLIDQDIQDIFVYLHEENVEFVKGFAGQSGKECYLKLTLTT